MIGISGARSFGAKLFSAIQRSLFLLISYAEKIIAKFAPLFFAAAVILPAWHLFWHQAYGGYASDFHPHLRFAWLLLEGKFFYGHIGVQALIIDVYHATGMSWVDSFIALLLIFTLGAYFTIYYLLRYFAGGDYSRNALLFVSLCVLIMSPVFVPGFYRDQHLRATPNLWHNSSLLALKPLAFLSFFWCLRLLEIPLLRQPGIAIALSALLLTGCLMKPSFVFAFLPLWWLYMLCFRTRDWQLWKITLILSIPSLVLLFWQYYLGFVHNPVYKPGSIQINYLAAWKARSINPYLSLTYATLFPLLILVCRWRQAARYFHFSWGLCLIAAMQYALLQETTRYSNFHWSLDISLQILFIFATIEWLRWIAECRQTLACSALTRISLHPVWLAGIVWIYHLFSGYLYLWHILHGGFPS